MAIQIHGGPSRNSDEEDLAMANRLMTTLATAGLMLALSIPIAGPVQAQQGGKQKPNAERGEGR